MNVEVKKEIASSLGNTPRNDEQLRVSGRRATSEGIKFHLDPIMLERLRNAPGFEPVIIDVQPVKDLHQFLGIQEDLPATGATSL